MIKKKQIVKKIVISVFLIIIFFQIPAFARYYECLQKVNTNAQIAEPVVRVELLQDTITASVNKINPIQESYFCLKNYVIENDNKRINETYFICDIEIELTDEKFPVKFELYDCLTGEEILKGSNKITRNKYS